MGGEAGLDELAAKLVELGAELLLVLFLFGEGGLQGGHLAGDLDVAGLGGGELGLGVAELGVGGGEAGLGGLQALGGLGEIGLEAGGAVLFL